ncbi:MAG: hypothetical protein V4456_07425 [Bacteroidota bacterium]
MKTLINLFALIALAGCCHAQITIKDTAKLPFFKDAVKASLKLSPSFNGSRLDSIGHELRRGDKSALLAIAPYFDSTTIVTEFLGHHILHPQQRSIAQRLIDENSLFLPAEIVIDENTSAAQFLAFIKSNFDAITFDKNAAAFLLTPLTRRNLVFEITGITNGKKIALQQGATKLLNQPWVKANYVNIHVDLHQSNALFEIAAAMFRNRNRFNYYDYKNNEYPDLLQHLTGEDVGVENELHKITHHIADDYSADSRLNLLVYYAKYAYLYEWNEAKKVFVNPTTPAIKPGKEKEYFEKLGSEVDSVAVSAFITLTNSNPVKVALLTDEYNKADIKSNRVLPIFPYRFLKQLSALTLYCRDNHINYVGSKILRQNITRLKSSLSFRDRRLLEDKMINTLTLDEIVAFEYWSLIDEESWELTFSAGRILDIFYSKNWWGIISSPKQMDAYLKRAMLYNNLGIIGLCNNYLNKFINADNRTLNLLKNHTSADKDVLFQKEKAINMVSAKKPVLSSKKYNDGNYDVELKNFESAFLAAEKLDSAARKDSISRILSKINYEQIGSALKLIGNYKWSKFDNIYSFMNRDFGFLTVDFNTPEVRSSFLAYYSRHSEYQTYAYYLKKAGINYKNAANNLDYDKIYNILKYNRVVAFSGGGGAARDNEVYEIIKILELTFKTRLGFPKKLCNSNNMYGCDTKERAIEWMAYLNKHRLLKLVHNDPVSFSYIER